jgi:hypothetical protein
MKNRITISVAALAVGAVLAAVPAFAQQAQPHYGKAVNDGGLIDEPSAPAGRALFNSVSQQMPSAPHYGKGVNDGGLVDQPNAAQLAAAQAQSKVAQQKPVPHYGKGVDDGGV